MKSFSPQLKIMVAALLLVFAATFAWAATKSYRIIGRNTKFTKDLWFAGEEKRTATDVALTSPTVTFSVEDRYLINLSSDANQTGVRPTGGELGQIVIIKSAAGSNTMRFDDNATTMALGGNITLTETQDEILALICLEETGTNSQSRWGCLYTHDN